MVRFDPVRFCRDIQRSLQRPLPEVVEQPIAVVTPGRNLVGRPLAGVGVFADQLSDRGSVPARLQDRETVVGDGDHVGYVPIDPRGERRTQVTQSDMWLAYATIVQRHGRLLVVQGARDLLHRLRNKPILGVLKVAIGPIFPSIGRDNCHSREVGEFGRLTAEGRNRLGTVNSDPRGSRVRHG